MDIVGRFLHPPSGPFFLFGPRGTGKSTWLARTYPEALRIDLLDPATERAYAARPERLAEVVREVPTAGVVIVDEVQRIPELLPVVHSLIEERRKTRFILTGSSARKLKRTGADLLAGRAALRRMHPFLAAELGGRFHLNEALARGMLPVVLGAPDPDDALAAYAGLYVREEIRAEGLVRNAGDFSRFLEVISFSHAAILNHANVARECELGRKAVESYVEILEDLLLAFHLDVFARRARRAMTAHPKFYFADAGLFRSLRPSGPMDRAPEAEGQALEGLVAQHLRAWIDYRGKRNTLHFWRTRAGSEVDFVLYGDDGLWGIEVKNAATVRPEDLRGLASFGDEYGGARRVILYRGKERFERAGILCLPCEAFLRSLRPDRSLEACVS